VAKRRNLKKEKAERNQMYARQFRKKTPSNGYSRGRRFGGGANGGGKRREEGGEEQEVENRAREIGQRLLRGTLFPSPSP
jgi:hypothetical protein